MIKFDKKNKKGAPRTVRFNQELDDLVQKSLDKYKVSFTAWITTAAKALIELDSKDQVVYPEMPNSCESVIDDNVWKIAEEATKKLFEKS